MKVGAVGEFAMVGDAIAIAVLRREHGVNARLHIVGGNSETPNIVATPEIARLARVSGLVVIEAIGGTDGRVKDMKVLRGHALLDEAAMAAVRQWRYQPLLLNGIPTEFVLTVTVVFSLTAAAQ